MLSRKVIVYTRLSKECVQKANKLNLSDRTVVNHFKSTAKEKWKMSTEEWINHMYDKRFKASH